MTVEELYHALGEQIAEGRGKSVVYTSTSEAGCDFRIEDTIYQTGPEKPAGVELIASTIYQA
jgi:hypothetical protein